ncbi:TetR family transcriptional regulator [Halalkalibacter krulwichiae]|uniref:Putative HTH-type transcriptional regulator YvdT n=1 Tax=Halalkalibacter krulwichiae TaxID=199441 RepID=A0A1Y9THE3_9BACI|nr:TetR family transcriptional regulator [Halalkalibacter krulwichiae]ARK28569.1 putative HTH-type transcriptional regulator YvdT [Halalkalibacter krulwichiae]
MPEAKDDKYKLIVDAACKVIREKGYEKASVSQIVKEAGVAQGTFYLYFDSKSALVPAIAERILHFLLLELKRHDQSSKSIHDTIKAVVETTFQITETYKELIELCYSGLTYYHAFERWEEIYQPYYDWLEEKLTMAVHNGSMQTKINLSYLTKMIINLAETTAETNYFSNRNENEIEEAKRQVLLFIGCSLTDCHSV